MNDQAASAPTEPSAAGSYRKYYLLGGAAVGVALLAYFLFSGSSKPPEQNTARTEREDPLQAARVALNRSTDLNTCRDALSEINQYLTKHPATEEWRLTTGEREALAAWPDKERQQLWSDTLQSFGKEASASEREALNALGSEQREQVRKAVETDLQNSGKPAKERPSTESQSTLVAPLAFAYASGFRAVFLKQHFQLRPDEWAEINSGTFTLLDGHYADECFLLRDVAASFAPEELLPASEPLRRAEAAFAWVVRQVRLTESREGLTDPMPVAFVLRRGHGTSLERALVFLSLLQQFDVPGCLVGVPDATPGKFRPWACGVVVGSELYLFDPRMGLPVPGAKGKGIATLAAAQSQPEILNQLALDKDTRYDVTPEQAGKAKLFVACPLSALAPRMRSLERILQDPDVSAPRISVRLGVDAASLFNQLARVQGKAAPAVEAWPSAGRALHGLLPTEEGGTDKTQRWVLARFGVIPMQAFPRELSRDLGRIYQMTVEKFGSAFLNLLLEPRQPRDHVLRGRYADASRDLTQMRQEILRQKAKLEASTDVRSEVAQALRNVIDAQAELQRAERQAGANAAQDAAANEARERLEAAWKKGRGWLDILVEGSAAGPLGAEVNYQLALCKHEQAERLQLRLEQAARSGKQMTKSEQDEVARAWRTAGEWWATYLQEYADAATASAARAQAARAQLMLGDRELARETLRDLSGRLTDLEKVGRLFLARQLESSAQ
jgi:hypothetical protein